MKKFIGLTMALAFGFFLVSAEAQRQQDPRMPQDQQERQEQQDQQQQDQQQQQYQQQAQQRVPVDKNDLPDEIVETIENEFDDWNLQQAFRVSGEFPGLQGTEGAEGIEQSRHQREGAAESADQQFFMLQLEKDGEFKTVHISQDGEKHGVPVNKNDLPDQIVQTIENEFQDWNLQQAFLVTGEQPGMEGAEGTEGIGQRERTYPREGAAESADQQYYMIQLEKDGEFKTVHLSEDGEKLDDHQKDKDQQKSGRQRNY
jgi:hypothetical protein